MCGRAGIFSRRAGGDRRVRAVPGLGGGVTIARAAAVFQLAARREHERRRHSRRHGRLRGRRPAEARAPAAPAALRAAAAAATTRPLLRAPQVPRAQTWRKPHPLHAHQWYHRHRIVLSLHRHYHASTRQACPTHLSPARIGPPLPTWLSSVLLHVHFLTVSNSLCMQ